jgi:hypothetical protein
MRIPLDALALAPAEPAAQPRIPILAFSSAQDIDAPSPLPEPNDATDDTLKCPASDDDIKWDVFLPDDDELDPLPDPGDFWIDPD